MSSTRHQYQAVAASQTDKALTSANGSGAKGDFLDTLIVSVTTSGANGTCDIQDGGDTAIPLVPASTPIGVYVIHLNVMSRTGAWSVTTGSAATALAIGRFS